MIGLLLKRNVFVLPWGVLSRPQEQNVKCLITEKYKHTQVMVVVVVVMMTMIIIIIII
jgi:hypothetical protein